MTKILSALFIVTSCFAVGCAAEVSEPTGSGGGTSGSSTSAGQCLPTGAECAGFVPCCAGECLVPLGCGSDCALFCQLPPYCSALGGPCRSDSDCCTGSCLGVIANDEAGSCMIGDAGADG